MNRLRTFPLPTAAEWRTLGEDLFVAAGIIGLQLLGFAALIATGIVS